MNNLYVQLIIAGLAAAAICALLIPLVIQVSLRLNLVDKPNARKVHMNPIPRMGGVAIMLGALGAILLSREGLTAIAQWPVLFSSVGVLFFVGLWDDVKDISARLRFMIQICCAMALAANGVRLTSLHGIFGIHELGAVWQYFITVLIIVGTTNAFNLIDGIDGLAGGLAFISIVVLTIIAYMLQMYPLVILLIAFGGSLLGFLYYNSSPAKIFMGDGGSLVLGYLMSAVSILLIEKAHHQPLLIHPSKVSILVTAILVIPVFDTIRVFARRIRKGKSPFAADKTHIHHLFLVAGLNHRKTAFILYGFELLLVGLAFLLPFAASMSITIVVMVILFHIITEVLWLNKGVMKWLGIIKKMEREGIR